MARAAIYYRVSTVDQSVNGQIKELRRYAKRRKFKIAGEYVDQCSGTARMTCPPIMFPVLQLGYGT